MNFLSYLYYNYFDTVVNWRAPYAYSLLITDYANFVMAKTAVYVCPKASHDANTCTQNLTMKPQIYWICAELTTMH